jgi:5-methylcytosine-specific restriction endonuclease McrA
MHWRAQAIERVITALRKLVPISHVVMLNTAHQPPLHVSSSTLTEQRQRLIDAYGLPDEQGIHRARCAYCGTTSGPIEVEHLVPLSRGGTDAHWNLTLACASCNRRKGDRTPDEAGMVPRFPDQSAQVHSQRAAPYIRLTARLLAAKLQQDLLPVADAGQQVDSLPTTLLAALLDFAAAPGDVMTVVAKPIGRPRKQVYTARNYPLSTPLRSGLERVGQTIKRRNRVNLGLVVQKHQHQTTVTVLKAGSTPAASTAPHIIRLGMLCRGEKAGESVTGIVQAIHSSGKLTLITPARVRPSGVSWQRTIISPRQGLRIVSTDRVVFMKVPATAD